MYVLHLIIQTYAHYFVEHFSQIAFCLQIGRTV